MARLTHLDDKGKASMVDVSKKPATRRMAVAQGSVFMQPATLNLIMEGNTPKGDVLAVARLAGIMAAKRTAELIPLCHTLALDHIAVEFSCDNQRSAIDITASAQVNGPTGVEMEALTAVSVAGLTIYDMCKAVDRSMRLSDIRLTHKSGGKSGSFDAA
jgi:cyclic pyranopterin phosphate synthase